MIVNEKRKSKAQTEIQNLKTTTQLYYYFIISFNNVFVCFFSTDCGRQYTIGYGLEQQSKQNYTN